jgi:dolichol-phosphate mannosyltransferase
VKKLISIITSAYNEEGNVRELAKQLLAVFNENDNYHFEVIFVENGSTDGTFQTILEVHNKDPRFKIVQLGRNFRMDGGITAGLHYATGHAAVIMTANLQDTPSLISEFIKKWEQGFEIVYGVVKRRPGKSILRRLNSEIFYWVINRLTNGMIPRNVSDFRLVSKHVYETINTMQERNRFLRGMFAWVGFKSIGVEFERQPRFSGTSHAPFLKVLHLAVQGIFSFSYVPIRAISFLGLIMSVFSILLMVYMVFSVFVYGVPFQGYGMLICLMLLLFGLLFLILGVIGQYIAQIYEEVKCRPNFIVRRAIGFEIGFSQRRSFGTPLAPTGL